MGLSGQGSVAEPSRRRLLSPTKRQLYNQPQAVPSPRCCGVGCGRGQGASGQHSPEGPGDSRGPSPVGLGSPFPTVPWAGGGVGVTGGRDLQGQEGWMGLRSPAAQPWDTPATWLPPSPEERHVGPLPRPSRSAPLAVGACGVDGETGPAPSQEGLPWRLWPRGLSSWRQPNPSASHPGC